MASLREQLETFKKLKYVSIVQAMLSYVHTCVCMYVRMHVHGICKYVRTIEIASHRLDVTFCSI